MDAFNVRTYGAVGDGVHNDTPAIRAALDACRAAGGGTVCFPAGDYLCGTLRLTDNQTLHLDAGAVLRESLIEDMLPTRISATGVERPHLLVAEGACNLAITGQGAIYGRGESETPGKDRELRGFRSGIVFFRDCRNITLSGIRILYGDAWTVHLNGCEDVFVQNLAILNNKHRIGGNDGLDLNSCRHVHIANCRIAAWDDCIVLKAKDRHAEGDATDCENIVVTNCTLESGCTALKIGSESRGNFRDIHFSNCAIRDSSVGFGIYLLDGATVERVTCSNLSMEIVDDRRYRPHGDAHASHIFPACIFVDRRTPESRLGRIRDVAIADVHTRSSYGLVVLGHPDSPIENLALRNVTLRAEVPQDFIPRRMPCSKELLEDRADTAYRPAYLNISHVRDLSLDTVRLYLADGIPRDTRAGIALRHVERPVLRDCTVCPEGALTEAIP